MKSSPFLIKNDVSGKLLHPIESHEHLYNESWLQELLRKYPDILPVAEIEPVFSPLLSIGCEVITNTGSIDNLFISPKGYLVLVETKLWRNPEAKRDVVAQAIDYGSSIAEWGYSKLDEIVKDYTKKYENNAMSLVEWVESHHILADDRNYFEETVVKNLRLGRFLTLIVGDRIRQSVIEMLNYVNKYPHLAISVALVELQCYRWIPNETWPLLVVPSIVARTEIVERSIIQVTVKEAGEYKIETQQEKVEDRGTRRKRVTLLSEEAFWELLKERVPESYSEVQKLIEHYRERDDITIETKEASLAVKLSIQDTGQQASIFHINKDAKIHSWVDDMIRQLDRAGLDGNKLTSSYKPEVRKILHIEKHHFGGYPISKIIVGEFTELVDILIADIQRSPKKES